jgi:hypothetical protein
MKTATEGSVSIARRIAILALGLLLFQVGFVRAAHYHSLEVVAQPAQHLDCTLCADANHVGLPLVPKLEPAAFLVWSVILPIAIFQRVARAPSTYYYARGPPRR